MALGAERDGLEVGAFLTNPTLPKVVSFARAMTSAVQTAEGTDHREMLGAALRSAPVGALLARHGAEWCLPSKRRALHASTALGSA